MTLRTLNDLFRRAVAQHDKGDAFLVKRDGAWTPVSHREAAAAVAELASGLADLGVAPGDRVAIFAENRLEWALADYAILAAGAVNVPIYATLPAPQVEFILRDSEARVLFVSTAAHRAMALSLRPNLRTDLAVISFEPLAPDVVEPAVTDLAALRERGRRRMAAHPAEQADRAAAVRESDIASIIYTSGTTGVPKGVLLSHGNIVSNIVASRQVMPLGPTDSCLSFLPLCHIFERMAGHYTMMDAGATIAYAESMDTVPQNLLEVRPTILVSVPRLYEKMHARVLDKVAASPPLRRRLFAWAVEIGRNRSLLQLAGRPVPASLEFAHRVATALVFSKLKAGTGGRIRFMASGGAPLAADIALFFLGAGLPILEGYGLTETSPVITCNRLDRIKLGSVGQPIPGVEVRIAADGEILVRGPGVMQGYYKLPEATAEALHDGWFHTGDVGFLDADGFLTITDRKKDLIVTAGGKNVAPQPIENRLKGDAWITEAVIIGDRRPYCVALVVPDFARLEAWARAEGIDGDRATLCRDPRVVAQVMTRVQPVNEVLAPFERIKAIGLIDRELTVLGGDLTPTLKVKRRVLAERFGPLIESLYAGHAPGHT